jgi:uncharacterized protein (TIGR00304 family)
MFTMTPISEMVENLASATLVNIGLLFVVVGFILALIAAILVTIKARNSGGQTKTAGILLIGPFPIVFGSDRESVRTLMILAIVLIAIAFAFMVLPSLLMSR